MQQRDAYHERGTSTGEFFGGCEPYYNQRRHIELERNCMLAVLVAIRWIPPEYCFQPSRWLSG